MSTRDDAIKAVQVAALKQWAPRMDGLTTWEAGVVVDAADPIIRADERVKRKDHWMLEWSGLEAQNARLLAERDAARADERAKALVRHLAKMEEFDEALDAARAEVEADVLAKVLAQIRSDAAVAEFGYGWHKVDELRRGYRKGDRRRAGLSRLADWLEGRT